MLRSDAAPAFDIEALRAEFPALSKRSMASRWSTSTAQRAP